MLVPAGEYTEYTLSPQLVLFTFLNLTLTLTESKQTNIKSRLSFETVTK